MCIHGCQKNQDFFFFSQSDPRRAGELTVDVNSLVQVVSPKELEPVTNILPSAGQDGKLDM